MAYTPPTTRATGVLITASIWNTDMVDNFSASWVGTTAGDMDYYTAATTKDRIPIGTAGYGLFSTGTAPAWAPGMKVILNDTSDTVKQSSDAGNEVYTFTIPANTLGTNGMLGICGNLTMVGSTTDNFSPSVWITYGSSNTSDGVKIGGSTDELQVSGGTGDTEWSWFDARLMAKGASAERIFGITINRIESGASPSVSAYSESIAIDQTASQELRLLHAGAATSDSCAFTLHNLMVYTVPYLTTT